MTQITTSFKYNRILDDFTIFNQPLYLLGSFIQNKLLNINDLSSDKNKYFEKLSMNEGNTSPFYLEIDTFKKIDKISDDIEISDTSSIPIFETINKITYLLDRIKFSEEFTFLYDGVKFIFKTDKVFDKNALSINRDCFAIFSTYTITCNK